MHRTSVLVSFVVVVATATYAGCASSVDNGAPGADASVGDVSSSSSSGDSGEAGSGPDAGKDTSTGDAGSHDASTTDAATSDAGGTCVIGGTTYASGQSNPANACQSCQPSTSASAWSAVTDGTTCASGICCAGTCVDDQTDTSHCGACGKTCGPYANAAASCVGAACVETCNAGFLDCSAGGLSGCKTVLDATNCGSCGNACPSQWACTGTTCTGGPIASYWFEGDYSDHGSAGNTLGPSPAPPSFQAGYAGQGIAVSAAGGQYAYLGSPAGVPLLSSPRTLEAWVQPSSTQGDATYNGIFAYGTPACSSGQLLSMSSTFQVTSANWCNDLIEPGGGPAASAGAWSHVAYTFDGTTRQLYLNGVAVASDMPAAFSTVSGAGDWLRVGTTDMPGRVFTGTIDEARIYDYARTPAQLLDDATLAARYWFDGASAGTDLGPNHVTAAMNGGAVATSGGRVGQAMSFDGMAATNVQVPSMTALGEPNQPFSIEMWIKFPTLPAGGSTLAFVNAPGGWCTPFLGLDAAGHAVAQVYTGASQGVASSGTMPANTWIHLAETWSATNGLRLYVNGVLSASDATATTYAASGQVNTVTLGNWTTSASCATSTVPSVPYAGLMDSIQIWSRERTAAELAYDALP